MDMSAQSDQSLLRDQWVAEVLKLNLLHADCDNQSGQMGAQLAQLVECQTLDRKVTGSKLTRGALLFP